MLALTDTASTLIATIIEQSPTTDTAGLRIQGAGTPLTEFQVSVATAPEPDDAIVERGGARVFLEGEAARALEDKILDAHVTQDGSVRFAIDAQP